MRELWVVENLKGYDPGHLDTLSGQLPGVTSNK
jgi:hypothetical protein